MLRSSEPPWFLGTMWSTSRGGGCGGRTPPRRAAFGKHRGAGGTVSAALRVVAPPRWLSARYRRRSAPPAHQVVSTSLVAGDAVAGKNLAHHALDAFGVVIDLGHVFPQDPPGNVLRGGGAAASQELHEHQGLVDVAHAHALGDGLAQALVGGGGGLWHGGILAGIPCAGRLAWAGGDRGWN